MASRLPPSQGPGRCLSSVGSILNRHTWIVRRERGHLCLALGITSVTAFWKIPDLGPRTLCAAVVEWIFMAKRISVDRWLFVVTLLLVFVGLVMVFSASAVMAKERYHSGYYFLLRQL